MKSSSIISTENELIDVILTLISYSSFYSLCCPLPCGGTHLVEQPMAAGVVPPAVGSWVTRWGMIGGGLTVRVLRIY